MADIPSFLKWFTEFVCTFVLVLVILTLGEAIPIAITLCALIFIAAKISGAHINPAVSISQWLIGKTSACDLGGYIVLQILGAVAAVYFWASFIKDPSAPGIAVKGLRGSC